MAALTIPKQFEQGIVKIINLPDEVATALVAALRASPQSLKPKALAASIAERVQGLSETEIQQLLPTLTSLYMARASLGISAQEFLESVVEAVATSHSAPANFTADTREKFKQRLANLLDVESFGVSVKAQEVLHEHQYALSRVRILTDIRPVFGNEKIESPLAAVLVHTMKITYLAEGEIREFFVAMDTSDIKMLKDALERAEKKAESIKVAISNTGLNIIEPE
jgi:hypothetical protein